MLISDIPRFGLRTALALKGLTQASFAQDLDHDEQYRALFESSLDAMLLLRPDGTVLRANEAARAMFGMTERQICERGRARLLAPEDPRWRAVNAQREGTGSARGELTLVRGDGSRFEAEISTTQCRVRDGSVQLNVTLRDISEQLRARREMLRANAELDERVRERTTQLEARNAELMAFASSLAHDLRSPLGAIDGFSALLEQSAGEPASDRNRHYLRRLRAASSQLGEYVDALLSLACCSQAPLRRAEVNLSAFATAVLSDLQERDDGRRAVIFVQQGLYARGDPSLLRMALENLLGNAWKFTGRRAIAQIDFGAQTGDDGQTVYYVKDNGAGFDSAWAGKLFGTFQRLHSQDEFPGTGVGLANVHRIITRHGGRVWAEAVEGAGATFRFTLPPEGGAEDARDAAVRGAARR